MTVSSQSSAVPGSAFTMLRARSISKAGRGTLPSGRRRRSSQSMACARARAAFSGAVKEGIPAACSVAGGPSRFMNTPTRAMSSASAARAAISSSATSADRVISGVLNSTMTASTSGPAPRMHVTCPYCEAVALAIMSTGLETLASGGSSDRSCAAVGAASSGTSRPLASQASAARIPGPPPLVTIATRRPRYRCGKLNTVATSSISSIDPARTTPAWCSKASTPTSPPDRAAVCDAAPRRPATVRPALTAMIGTRRPMRRATRTNDAGSGIDSRYSKITSAADSSSQYRRRSLVDTSTAFPIDTKAPMPRPRASAASRTASPTAPDWLSRNAPPAAGSVRLKVALNRPSPTPPRIPVQFGPSNRTPRSRAVATRRAWRAAPVRPDLGEPGRYHAHRRDAEAAGLGHHVVDRIGRHAHDDEIRPDRAGGEIGKGRNAAHRPHGAG